MDLILLYLMTLAESEIKLRFKCEVVLVNETSQHPLRSQMYVLEKPQRKGFGTSSIPS